MKRGWNLYFWTIGNGHRGQGLCRGVLWFAFKCVSLCSQIIITTQVRMLWFAFKCVSLCSEKRRFDLLERDFESCDLLSNLYLWTIGNNSSTSFHTKASVVICFQICTFEPLETTWIMRLMRRCLLWFAFKFVPLNHWKQLHGMLEMIPMSCDLLSNLYLWTIGNNKQGQRTDMAELWFAFKFVPLNHWKQLLRCNSFW